MDDHFRITGRHKKVVFYPSHVPVIYRIKGGVAFELDARGWHWIGPGERQPCALIDVLAAAVHAGIPRTRVVPAHLAAIKDATARGDVDVLALLAEQAAEALDLIDVAGLAKMAKVDERTARAYRTTSASGRRTPPGVIASGTGTRHTWLWSRIQLERWLATRPGSGRVQVESWSVAPSDER